VYNTDTTDTYTLLDNFNGATPTMQFTTEEEQNDSINFLDITITRDRNHFTLDIYRKLTATDSIIPQDSYHPIEQKLSTIHYLQNRIATYPTDKQNKRKETQIVDHILFDNNYSVMTLNTRKNRNKNEQERVQSAEKMVKIHIYGR
jgi:hypothetical protein